MTQEPPAPAPPGVTRVVRLLQPYRMAGGASYVPGEVIALPEPEALHLVARGAAESAKAPTAPPKDKMIRPGGPGRVKGQADGEVVR